MHEINLPDQKIRHRRQARNNSNNNNRENGDENKYICILMGKSRHTHMRSECSLFKHE